MGNSLDFTIPELRDASAVVGVLCDILKPTSATVIARYTQDYYAGKPAITLNHFGSGRAIYIGAVGEAQLYDLLAKWLLDTTGLQDNFATPSGVEVTQRMQGASSLHFIMNHKDSLQTIHLEASYMDLFTRKQLKGNVQVEPFGVLILASSSAE
jgi:beta-galactosidase